MQRRKTNARGRGMKSARGTRDATLREFKERDLGGDIESAGAAVDRYSRRPHSAPAVQMLPRQVCSHELVTAHGWASGRLSSRSPGGRTPAREAHSEVPPSGA
jgi:hypothetical protein